ncbi:MAG: DUF998 domain-containing protein [Actinomycetota bacterium]
MSRNTVDLAPGLTRGDVKIKGSRARFQMALLACGGLYSVLYVVANDLVAATRYKGYSRMSQAISELSATGPPTKPFHIAILPIFSLLLIAFGIGVWKSAHRTRALRVTGGLFIVHGITAVLWLPFPITSREDMIEGTAAVNDIGLIVLSAVSVLLILSQIGFGAAAFGRRFRLFSVVTAVTVVVFGALTGMQSSKVSAGGASPWMGLFERISLWS